MPKPAPRPPTVRHCVYCGGEVAEGPDRSPGPDAGTVQHSAPGICIRSLVERVARLEEMVEGPDR
jgi:hypothetical protein